MMQPMRVLLTGLAGFVTYFILGGLLFGLFPAMRNEFLRYPAIYRPQDGIRKVMPVGMLAMLIAILMLAILFAGWSSGNSGSGVMRGAIFGALIGIYAIGSFVIHNYVNLQIGVRITVQQAVAYFIEWLAVGVVMGLVYR